MGVGAGGEEGSRLGRRRPWSGDLMLMRWVHDESERRRLGPAPVPSFYNENETRGAADLDKSFA